MNTEQKIQELLKPRYKVIGDFPHSSMPVGMVFCKEYSDGDFWDKYPHLFRKLEWWEERTVEEMPEYIKIVDTGEVVKVDTYRLGIGFIANNLTIKKVLSTNTLPATEQEYLTYKNNNS